MGGSLMQMLQQYGGGQQFQGGGGGNLGGALGLPNGAPMQLRGGGGGYAQPMRRYDPDFGDPRRAQGMGEGGGVVSAPDGTVYGGGATSPFEVGGDSGRPISAGNGYGGAQPPGGGGYGGGVENTPGGMDLQDLARRFAQSNPHYGDLSWGERMRGREGDPRDMGNGQMAGGMPPWMQRRNPGTRDDMRRGYWDRGMNDQGGQQQMPQRPMGGYWQRPMGGPMPGQGIPLGAGGREMPMPGQAPQMQMPQTQGGMIKSAAPQQQQSYQPAQAPAQAQAPQQPVRRATRDDNNVRGWSGY